MLIETIAALIALALLSAAFVEGYRSSDLMELPEKLVLSSILVLLCFLLFKIG